MVQTNLGDSLAILRWLVDAGADEATLDAPVDRLNAAPAAPVDLAAKRARTAAAAAPPAKAAVAASAAIAAAQVSLSTAPGAARALAASCTNLAELKAAVESFDGCELKRYCTNTVFADGSPDGRVMFIGEAPGAEEDKKGLPFVGRAGQLLDRMLNAIGLDRTNAYITNVLMWRPPNNRDPSPEESATCLPFLTRHIELANPEVMILLGAVSARNVLGLSEGIMKLRGKWGVYHCAGRAIPVMPTLHPAYLLRQPSAKRLAWRDLLAVREKMDALGLG
jgi:uracil-DNA glycosylase